LTFKTGPPCRQSGDVIKGNHNYDCRYLRQWANGGAGGSSMGRIVILTLHPPTYEIFMMLSRILLVSAGRVMFSGRRRDMLPYFALVDYPCPNFKNPSDYYCELNSN